MAPFRSYMEGHPNRAEAASAGCCKETRRRICERLNAHEASGDRLDGGEPSETCLKFIKVSQHEPGCLGEGQALRMEPVHINL